MANEKVSGTVVLRITSLGSLRSKDGAKLKLGGKQRTPVIADGQLIGYAEKTVPAEIEATLVLTANTPLDALNNITDDVALFETDAGVVYTVRGVFSTEPPEITGGEGEVAVKYAGQPAQRTT